MEEINGVFEHLKVNNEEMLSRVFWKNAVFKVEKNGKYMVLKLFAPNTDQEHRFKNEIFFLDYFNSLGILSTPELYSYDDYHNYKYILMEYVSGVSLKQMVKQRGLNYCSDEIEKYFSDISSVWKASTTGIHLESSPEWLGKGRGITEDEFINNLLEIIDFEEIVEVVNFYKAVTPGKVEGTLINSDVSSNELIFNENKRTWIDFERYRMGDPNLDLARAFHSLTSSSIDNQRTIMRILENISGNYYFNKNNFKYYLLQKCLSNAYSDGEKTKPKELKLYLDIAKGL